MTSPSTASPARAPWWRQALVWLVGVGLLGLLLSQVPLDTALAALRAPDAVTWAITLAGLVLSYVLRAARLQVVLGLDDTRPGARRWLGLRLDALRVILMHNAAVNLLPMRAGELSFPWLASRHLGMPLDRSVASLLWMRLQDLAVLLALGALCWPGLALHIRAGAVLMLGLGWWASVRLLARLHARWASPTAADSLAGWRRVMGKLHTALVDPHHHRMAAWGFTWANWTVKLAAGAGLLAAITATPWSSGWSGALTGELAAVVPVQGPAGFGTYEAGVWAGYALHLGPTAPQLPLVVPAALALHVCFLLCAVGAGLLAWLLRPASAARIPD